MLKLSYSGDEFPCALLTEGDSAVSDSGLISLPLRGYQPTQAISSAKIIVVSLWRIVLTAVNQNA